jgi:hypothetical protein
MGSCLLDFFLFYMEQLTYYLFFFFFSRQVMHHLLKTKIQPQPSWLKIRRGVFIFLLKKQFFKLFFT